MVPVPDAKSPAGGTAADELATSTCHRVPANSPAGSATSDLSDLSNQRQAVELVQTQRGGNDMMLEAGSLANLNATQLLLVAKAIR